MENIDPLFSIIVPVYNVENYLETCVNSLFNNIDSDKYKFEVILVDDGSKDRSSKICDELAQKYYKVKAFHKQNGGLSDARNFGIGKSTGKFILFIDSDDYVDNHINDAFSLICENQDIEVFQFGINVHRLDIVNNDNIYRGINKVIQINDDLNRRSLIFNSSKSNSACLKILSKKFLIENDLYFVKGILSEDFEWTPRVWLALKSVYLSDITYYHYIAIRENSIMNSPKEKYFTDLIEISKMTTLLYDEKCKQLKSRIQSFLAFNILSGFRKMTLLPKKEQKLLDKLLKQNFNLIKKINYFPLKVFCYLGKFINYRFLYRLFRVN